MVARTNPGQNSPQRIRVLIVDDHAAVRHAMTGDALAQVDTFELDVVVIAGEGPTDTALVAHILCTHPELPVVCVGLEEHTVRVYRGQRVAATSINLLEAIQGL